MSDSIGLVVIKSPEEKYSLQNVAVVSDKPPNLGNAKYAIAGDNCYLTVVVDKRIPAGKIGLSSLQREWLGARLSVPLPIRPYRMSRGESLTGTISLELDFFTKPKKAMPAINTDELAPFFIRTFVENVFCRGQHVLVGFEKFPMLKATVLQITAEDLSVLTGKTGKGSKKIPYGLLVGNSRVIFEKKADSPLQLIGRHKGDSAHVTIISPDWDFKQMGIGGLDKEFSDIFRRAFASRVFPPDVVEQLGMKHVRGILLFGPPGTGKTLMARQIGKMLHAREPKIVNGPEVLNKYVGESEANIRNLFAEADSDQKKMGINSALHIIIFDEIDAICRTRGSLSGSSGVHDTVVNQLLAKIDGVEQLNNILVIGMTNRKDMIDEALLRPGRLEVQMEIGLPDENGRVEILNIHTALMVKNNKLKGDVDINELASRTRNFSGAELEGLVRSAQATAMNKLIKAKDKVLVTHEEADKLQVTMADFHHALDYDVKPAFGISEDELDNYAFNGIIQWGPQVQHILDMGTLAVKQTVEGQRTPLVSVLLRGNPGCGKTALAATIAKQSGFPFVKVISPENMVGYSEGAKCQAIKKVFDDAYKSELSCVVIDDMERLLDYIAIGPRFSNLVVQALLVLLRKKPPIIVGKPPHKLLIIGTTGFKDDLLELIGITDAFDSCVEVPYLTSGDDILGVLRESSIIHFSDEEIKGLEKRLKTQSCFIGIRKLLSMMEAARLSGDCVPNLVKRLEQEAMLTK